MVDPWFRCQLGTMESQTPKKALNSLAVSWGNSFGKMIAPYCVSSRRRKRNFGMGHTIRYLPKN
jgi:hypothetical protein